MLGEQRLRLRSAQAGLENDGHRGGVDSADRLHPDQVEADHPGVPLPTGDQPADDGRASSERDDGQVAADCHGDHGGDLVVSGGPHDDVRRIGEVAVAGPEQVGGRLAAGPDAAYVVVGEHVARTQQLDELGERIRRNL